MSGIYQVHWQNTYEKYWVTTSSQLSVCQLLWPPYGIRQVIIFSSRSLFMAALCNRAGHIYFHPVVSFFFFPRLISAVGDWMSTILPHMVWPYCKFRMQIWSVLHVARWKYTMQKIAKKSPSGHHPTTLSSYIFLQIQIKTNLNAYTLMRLT